MLHVVFVRNHQRNVALLVHLLVHQSDISQGCFAQFAFLQTPPSSKLFFTQVQIIVLK